MNLELNAPTFGDGDVEDLVGFDFGDEEEAEAEPPEKTEEELVEEDKAAAEVEFLRVFKNWMRHVVDWRAIFKDAGLPESGELVCCLIVVWCLLPSALMRCPF